MPLPDTTYSKGQQNFIEQMTRRKLVKWCDEATHSGVPTVRLLDSPYVRHGQQKKFISHKGDGWYKVLSGGWAAAASFLKR
jgi:hypothetical protein